MLASRTRRVGVVTLLAKAHLLGGLFVATPGSPAPLRSGVVGAVHPSGSGEARGVSGETTGMLKKMGTTTTTKSGTTRPPRRVAVIGAGAGGLVAAKTFREYGFEVVVFEASKEVGGIWRRNGEVAYAGLRCNLPHQIMAFKDAPFSKAEAKGRSFVTGNDVGEYLRRYGEEHGVDVVFDAKVENVRILETDETDTPKWRLEVARGDGDSKKDTLWFDGVVVASGHYAKPAKFRPPGAETFPGRVTHSKDYNIPTPYKGKTIVCVGARSSGTDLAKEMVFDGDARRVIVADKACAQRACYFGGKLCHAPPVSRLEPDGAVIFADGSKEPNVDEIVSCVGFEYDFPFFFETHDTEDTHVVEVGASGRAVRPLYKHLFHALHADSLFFLGLPHSVVPFPLMQVQSLAAAAVFAGKVRLPSLEQRLAETADDRKKLVRPQDAHKLADRQWDYAKDLLRLGLSTIQKGENSSSSSGHHENTKSLSSVFAGLRNTDSDDDDSDALSRWDAWIDANRAVYNHVGPRRPAIPGAPDVYRRLEYEVDHAAGTWRCRNEPEVDAAIERLYRDAVHPADDAGKTTDDESPAALSTGGSCEDRRVSSR